MGRRKKYLTEEERKAAKKESMKKWRRANKEHIKEYSKEYNEANKEHRKAYMKEYNEANREHYKEYYKTPMGRASNLVSSYRQSDKEMGRGECTLTAQWVVDNIFTKPCIYCGESDWRQLGCDRIDNSKPHTPDNVVPCCEKCNKKRQKKTFEVFLKETRSYE